MLLPGIKPKFSIQLAGSKFEEFDSRVLLPGSSILPGSRLAMSMLLLGSPTPGEHTTGAQITESMLLPVIRLPRSILLPGIRLPGSMLFAWIFEHFLRVGQYHTFAHSHIRILHIFAL